MRPGHREAQNLFLSTGRRLGFHPKLTWTREYPTDGVWLTPERGPAVPHLPVVALEVVVSESPKSVRGSIATLEAVSPALGVLLIQEEEIRRGLIRRGFNCEEAAERLRRVKEGADAFIRTSRQRLERWSYRRLQSLSNLTTKTIVRPSGSIGY